MSQRNPSLASDLQGIRHLQPRVRQVRCLRVDRCMLVYSRSHSPVPRARKSQSPPLLLTRSRDRVCPRPVLTRTTHRIRLFQGDLVSQPAMIGWHGLIHEASSSNSNKRHRRLLNSRFPTGHHLHCLVNSRIRRMDLDSHRQGQRCQA